MIKKWMMIFSVVFYCVTVRVLVKKIANINAGLCSVHERSELMRQWIAAAENGRSVYGYLKRCGYDSVVFICPKEWKHMLDRKNTQIHVQIIDQETLKPGQTKQDLLPGNDRYNAVILADPGNYRELSYRLYDLADVPILNFADILTMMNKESAGYA